MWHCKESKTMQPARMVMKKSKRNHITPLLQYDCIFIDSPFLPVLKYKIATLIYHHFDKTLPLYLSSSTYRLPWTLTITSLPVLSRLSGETKKLLKVPRINVKSFGYRFFSYQYHYQAPTVWNSLPSGLQKCPSLSSFKSDLKTYLFQKSF